MKKQDENNQKQEYTIRTQEETRITQRAKHNETRQNIKKPEEHIQNQEENTIITRRNKHDTTINQT